MNTARAVLALTANPGPLPPGPRGLRGGIACQRTGHAARFQDMSARSTPTKTEPVTGPFADSHQVLPRVSGTMSEQETVYDSPSQWVADHIRDYVETGGEKGHDWRGAPTLLLTTRGRKTGRLRRTALIYGRMGDAYVVVASKGGAPQHPMWYLNLKANPDVQVQVGPDVFDAVARDATDDERPFLWEQMVSIWPAYDDYQEKTTRRIPLVVIEPTTGAE